jgi:hypothetical protein
LPLRSAGTNLRQTLETYTDHPQSFRVSYLLAELQQNT